MLKSLTSVSFQIGKLILIYTLEKSKIKIKIVAAQNCYLYTNLTQPHLPLYIPRFIFKHSIINKNNVFKIYNYSR